MIRPRHRLCGLNTTARTMLLLENQTLLLCIGWRSANSQGGRKTYNPTDGDDGTEGTFPIEFNQNCKAIYASYPYQQNHIVAAGFDDNTTFRIWAKNISGNRVAATVAYIAYGI